MSAAVGDLGPTLARVLALLTWLEEANPIIRDMSGQGRDAAFMVVGNYRTMNLTHRIPVIEPGDRERLEQAQRWFERLERGLVGHSD